MLTAALATALIGGTPTHHQPPDNGCWTAPLQLSIADLGTFGRIYHKARRHCAASPREHNLRPQSYTIGRTQLVRFGLFGEQLSLHIDVVMVPSLSGTPDAIYASPTLDLPEKWDRAIATATTPVLVVGSAAILGTVVYQLLK